MRVLCVNMAGSSMAAVARHVPGVTLLTRAGLYAKKWEKVLDFSATEKIGKENSLKYSATIREKFDKGGYSVIHASGWNGGVPAFLSRRKFGIVFQGTDLRTWRKPGDTKGLVKWALQRCTLASAEYVAVSTPDLLSIAKRHRSDAFYMPNAIDLNQFHPQEANVELPPRALSAGRIDHTKGVDIIFGAVGGSPWLEAVALDWGIDPEYSLVRDMKLRNLAFKPIVDHAEMPKILSYFNVLLGQCKLGAVGQCELEAAACGVPVVAYSAEGFPALREKPGIKEYSGELYDLIHNSDRRRRVSDEQRRFVSEFHDVHKVAKKWVNVWSRV